MTDDEPDLPEPPAERNPRLIVLVAIVVEGALILLAWGLGLLFDHPPLDTFHWHAGEALIGLAGTAPMLALFFACVRWPVGPLVRIREFCDNVIRPLFAPCTVLDLAGIALLAGLGEEMLFRGVLQAAGKDWCRDPWLGLALASVLFGIAHAVTPMYAVLAALLGAYLGWLWLWTENLLAVVIAHGVYDFIAFMVLVRMGRPKEAIV